MRRQPRRSSLAATSIQVMFSVFYVSVRAAALELPATELRLAGQTADETCSHQSPAPNRRLADRGACGHAAAVVWHAFTGGYAVFFGTDAKIVWVQGARR